MSNKHREDITIYDLANRLNLSAATVSRSLNDHPAISKITKKRVFELAQKIGYRQNDFAKSLRKQRTQTIGIIVHEFNSNFIASVLTEIEKVLTDANYNIIIGHSDEQSAREVANVSNLFQKRVDGLIASLAFDTTEISHFDIFLKKNIPVVFFDRVKKEGLGIKIIIDNEKAGWEATNHLIREGCKNILHVTGNLAQNVYCDRLKGFRRALSENGLTSTEQQVIINDLSESAGIDVALQILKMEKKPDGLFVTNDLCAAVCMQRLRQAGVKIPDEIAVVGFNNDIISRVVEPRITTVQYCGRQIGKTAATSLLEQLNGKSKAPKDYTMILRHEFIVRESSSKGLTNNSRF